MQQEPHDDPIWEQLSHPFDGSLPANILEAMIAILRRNFPAVIDTFRGRIVLMLCTGLGDFAYQLGFDPLYPLPGTRIFWSVFTAVHAAIPHILYTVATRMAFVGSPIENQPA